LINIFINRDATGYSPKEIKISRFGMSEQNAKGDLFFHVSKSTRQTDQKTKKP